MRAVAFDFDGVLCDSSREVFVVAVDTYASMAPESGLISELRPLRDEALAGGDRFRRHPHYRRFVDLLPLGNRAEDFGAALAAIERGADVPDQDRYDAFFGAIDRRWLERFHAGFYEQRSALRRADREAWISLHLPYPGLADAIREHCGGHELAVVTAKDARSVEALLESLGLGGIFGSDRILDKETGVVKTDHLGVLRRRSGVEFDRTTFIDDKLNHLCAVAPLGVRPVLAGWGFNTRREHLGASARGFEIATVETAGAVLFREACE